MPVRWLRRSLRNLDEEATYIARDDPKAAARIVEHIVASVDQLAAPPAMGRPGRVPGTRELIVSGSPYLVPYRMRGGTVEVLAVFHGARKWPDKL